VEVIGWIDGVLVGLELGESDVVAVGNKVGPDVTGVDAGA
jgi:hypothetical protein